MVVPERVCIEKLKGLENSHDMPTLNKESIYNELMAAARDVMI